YRQDAAPNSEDEIPCGPPERMVDVTSELDRDASQEERPEDEKDREVEARQSRSEHGRERNEQRSTGRQQPHFVGGPERPNRSEHLPSLPICSRHEEMQGAGAQIESVEHDVGGHHQGGNREPQLNQHAPPPRGVAARSLERRRTGPDRARSPVRSETRTTGR